MAKRWSVVVVVLALLLTVAPLDALGKKKKKKPPPPPPPPVVQTVEGSVTFPAILPDTANPGRIGCFAGLHRRLVLAMGEQPQGYVGYHFDVDPATYGGNFVLEVTGGQQSPDLDILFYSDFGSNPNTAPAETITYETREAGGEEGAIPPDKPKVIVCMYSGFESEFKYTGTSAGPAPVGSPGASPSPSPTTASPSPTAL